MTESIPVKGLESSLDGLWTEVDRQLEFRGKLLEQAIKFHQMAQIVTFLNSSQKSKKIYLFLKIKFAEKMNEANKILNEIKENEISSSESGFALIEKHQSTKKEILETSLVTFEEGKELLAKLKEMSIYADTYDTQASANACHSIENLLELLNDRRRFLESLWEQRKLKLEHCIQISYLRDEIKKVSLSWILHIAFQITLAYNWSCNKFLINPLLTSLL